VTRYQRARRYGIWRGALAMITLFLILAVLGPSLA